MKLNQQLKTTMSLAAAMGTLGLTATSANAALIAVDFGSTVNVQAGFSGQSTDSVVHATTAGNITVAYSGQQGNQGLSSVPSTVEGYNMYNDGLFKNGGTITLTLSGAGISNSTAYDLTFWSFYSSEARNTSVAATAGTTGTTIGPIGTATADPTGLSDSRYAGTSTFTSDSSGNLTFSLTGASSRPLINGFQVVAVPEPSTTALLGLGGLALILRRRK